jgi:hypothetical protein
MRGLIQLAVNIRCEMHALKEFIFWNSRKFSEHLGEEWIDSRQAMTVLKIKKRALQKLRDNGLLPFSLIRGKLYYKSTDLESLLKTNYMKRGNRQQATGNRQQEK